MSVNQPIAHQTSTSEKRDTLPTSKTSILSKTILLSGQPSQKGGALHCIDELFSDPLIFLHAIYQLQLQRDAAFLGNT